MEEYWNNVPKRVILEHLDAVARSGEFVTPPSGAIHPKPSQSESRSIRSFKDRQSGTDPTNDQSLGRMQQEKLRARMLLQKHHHLVFEAPSHELTSYEMTSMGTFSFAWRSIENRVPIGPTENAKTLSDI